MLGAGRPNSVRQFWQALWPIQRNTAQVVTRGLDPQQHRRLACQQQLWTALRGSQRPSLPAPSTGRWPTMLCRMPGRSWYCPPSASQGVVSRLTLPNAITTVSFLARYFAEIY
jgi:hypothetical protein